METLTTMDVLQLKGIIIGMILGDGCLKRNTFCSSSINLDYLNWKGEILSNLTKIKISSYAPMKGHYGTKPMYYLTTLSHPIYKKLRMRMYCDNNCRTIDPYILKTLTPLGLLFWYLDDGCLDKSCGLKFGIYSNRYSYGDHLLFQKYLNDRFGLRFNIRQSYKKQKSKRYFWLYLKAIDRLRFYDNIIYPHLNDIPEEMLYKIPKREDLEKLMASSSHKRFYENIV